MQYQVIGDSNHNDSEPASVSVTIARQPVDVPKADATVFTYDGEKKTYTIAENDNYTVCQYGADERRHLHRYRYAEGYEEFCLER